MRAAMPAQPYPKLVLDQALDKSRVQSPAVEDGELVEGRNITQPNVHVRRGLVRRMTRKLMS